MEKLVHQHVMDTLNSVFKLEHNILTASRKLLSGLMEGEKGYYLYVKPSLEKVYMSDDFDIKLEKVSQSPSRNGPLLVPRLSKQEVGWDNLYKSLNTNQRDVNFGVSAMKREDLPDMVRLIGDPKIKETLGSIFENLKIMQCNYFMHVQTLAKLHPKLTRSYYALSDLAIHELLNIQPVTFFLLNKIVLFPRFIELSSATIVSGRSMSVNKKAWVWAYELLADTIDEEKLRVNLLELLKIA